MKTNLLDLTDEELKTFLTYGISEDFLRKLYVNIPKLAEKLKGFRPQKASHEILVDTSCRLIKREKNVILLTELTKFYDNCLSGIEVNVQKNINNGYSKTMAFSIVVNKVLNDDFRPLFYRLENINEATQKEISEDISLLFLIRKENLDIKDQIFENINKKYDNLNNEIQNLNCRVDEVSEKLLETNVQLKKNSERLDDNSKRIQANADTLIDKNYVNSIIYEREKALKKEIDTKLEDIDKLKAISELESKISNLETQISFLKTAYSKVGFKTLKVVQDDYCIMDDDEYINEDIGDVIEKVALGGKFNVFGEYLKEVIYSNKPVLTSSKNSELITSVISSIVSGGNYYILTSIDDFDIDELIEKINTLKESGITPVFLVKNVIGVIDSYHSWLTSLKMKESDCKFIFELEYEKELKFLPKEIINDFIFYSGKMDSSLIEYRYVHIIKERRRINNNEFSKTIELLGIDIEDKTLANVNFCGLLAYSLIPFKAIHDGINREDLFNQINDPKLRNDCKAVLDD